MYYVNPMFESRRRLAGLGDAASTMVQIDSNDVLGIGDQLRSAQADLTNLLQQMRQSPDVARAIGRDVTAQQAALGDLISKYVFVYTSIFGQAPPGLGIAPILVGAAIAGAVAIIVAGLAVWWEKERAVNTNAQAAVTAENNRASVIAMAQQKQADAEAKAAAGDAAGAADAQAAAQAILAQAGIPGSALQQPPPPGTQTFSDWVKANWISVALIGGAVVIVPRLINR